MPRSPKSAKQSPVTGDTSPSLAATNRSNDERKNHNKDGTFTSGNTVAVGHNASLPGVGVPKKRFDARYWLRRTIEIDPADLPPVSMTPADRFARKTVRILDELEGRDYVHSQKAVLETAYGALVVQEASDHATGQAARDKVDSVLAQADELRRQSREARGIK
jgi:hypothetical protein